MMYSTRSPTAVMFSIQSTIESEIQSLTTQLQQKRQQLSQIDQIKRLAADAIAYLSDTKQQLLEAKIDERSLSEWQQGIIAVLGINIDNDAINQLQTVIAERNQAIEENNSLHAQLQQIKGELEEIKSQSTGADKLIIEAQSRNNKSKQKVEKTEVEANAITSFLNFKNKKQMESVTWLEVLQLTSGGLSIADVVREIAVSAEGKGKLAIDFAKRLPLLLSDYIRETEDRGDLERLGDDAVAKRAIAILEGKEEPQEQKPPSPFERLKIGRGKGTMERVKGLNWEAIAQACDNSPELLQVLIQDCKKSDRNESKKAFLTHLPLVLADYIRENGRDAVDWVPSDLIAEAEAVSSSNAA